MLHFPCCLVISLLDLVQMVRYLGPHYQYSLDRYDGPSLQSMEGDCKSLHLQEILASY